jgi:hypothetical protein
MKCAKGCGESCHGINNLIGVLIWRLPVMLSTVSTETLVVL